MADIQKITEEIQKHEKVSADAQAQILKLKGELQKAVDQAQMILGTQEIAPKKRGRPKGTSKASKKTAKKTAKKVNKKAAKKTRTRATAEDVEHQNTSMLKLIGGTTDCSAKTFKESWGNTYPPVLNRLKARGWIIAYGTNPRNTTYRLSKEGVHRAGSFRGKANYEVV